LSRLGVVGASLLLSLLSLPRGQASPVNQNHHRPLLPTPLSLNRASPEHEARARKRGHHRRPSTGHSQTAPFRRDRAVSLLPIARARALSSPPIAPDHRVAVESSPSRRRSTQRQQQPWRPQRRRPRRWPSPPLPPPQHPHTPPCLSTWRSCSRPQAKRSSQPSACFPDGQKPRSATCAARSSPER